MGYGTPVIGIGASKILFRWNDFATGEEGTVRLLIFTLLAIAAGVGIQLALTHLPYGMDHALGRFILLLMLVLPVIATAGLAYAMRIWNWYVVLLAILSPFVAWVLMVFSAVIFFQKHGLSIV